MRASAISRALSSWASAVTVTVWWLVVGCVVATGLWAGTVDACAASRPDRAILYFTSSQPATLNTVEDITDNVRANQRHAGGQHVLYLDYFGVALSTPSSSNNWYTTRPAVQSTVQGTKNHDMMLDVAGGATLVGGLGDDTYLVVDSRTKIIELPNQGNDTVISYTHYVLPSNVERLVLQANMITGIAADTGSLVTSLGLRNNLVSGVGNDVLADETVDLQNIFVFDKGSGRDVIYGFSATGENHDIIRINDPAFSTFAKVQSALAQVGNDVRLTFSANDAVLIKNVKLGDLSADDFLLTFSPTGLKQTFADEFDGISLYNAQTGHGTWKTSYTYGPSDGWSSISSRTLAANGELEIYVDPTYAGDPAKNTKPLGINPFSVKDGVLSITATKLTAQQSAALYDMPYASGVLTTEKTFAQTYGYFEIRAELNMTKGLFPAFWLLPTSRTWPPEIDIFENVGQNYTSAGSIAGDGSNAFYTYFPDGLTGMHTYGLLWTAEKITWYVDGQAVGSIPTPADMHQDMYMIVNLAVGGHWAGSPDPDFTSASINIDYVRVYSLDAIEAAASAGNRTIATADNHYVLPDDIHNLSYSGTADATLVGNALSNIIHGGAGNDLFHLEQGGADQVFGGAGNDAFYFGAAMTADDVVDGGTGNDTLGLQGDYRLSFGPSSLVNVETIALLSGSDARFGDSGGHRYSYDLTTDDANVGAGAMLTVNFNRLQPGENVNFDGSAETDGAFLFYAGFGDDHLIGGAGVDGFFFGDGGRFSAADRIDGGGSGNDQVGLCGDYSAGVTLSATTITNIQSIALLSSGDPRAVPGAGPYCYNLTFDDANVAAGTQFTVSGVRLAANEWIHFDGSAETNGSFQFLGGAGDDILIGGSGADIFYGGKGADTFTGGGGGDIYRYVAATDSTAAAQDRILDFAQGDRIALSEIDANAHSAGRDAFTFIGADAFTGRAGELRIVGAGSQWTVEADVNGDGAADFVLGVHTLANHVLAVTDLII